MQNRKRLITAHRKRLERKRRSRRLVIEPLESRQLLAGVPELLGDIAPGAASSFPGNFTYVGGVTYFSANATQVWKTDGTVSGTVLVHDTGSAGANVYLTGFHNHQGTLVFVRIDRGSDGSFLTTADDRLQLWKTDGASGGTLMVRDFGEGSFLNLSEGAYFTSIEGTLFTTIGTTETGVELWKTDLTSSGTVLVTEINPGTAGSYPTYLTERDGTLFFSASDGVSGQELWKSDGTSAGTVLVKDLDSTGSAGSYPQARPNGFVEMDGDFFFAARSSGSDGVPFNEDDTGQLWRSDGTAAGTVVVKDFGAGSSSGGQLINVDGTLFGTVRTAEHGTELWKSDGTSSGTVLVKDIDPSSGSYPGSSYPYNLTNVNGMLFFSANDGEHGTELWKSDGTSSGTVLVKDISPSVGSYPGASFPSSLTNVNGTLYFSADDDEHGRELWKSDGTEAGTVLVHDINQTVGAYGSGGAGIYPMAFLNGVLFFGADNGVSGTEPWALHLATDSVDLVVSIDESVDPATPESGLTHTITVRNSGPAAATGVALMPSLYLPSGVSVTSSVASAGTYSGGTNGTWSVGSLDANESQKLTFTLGISTAAGVGLNVVQGSVSVTEVDQMDCDEANNFASVSTSIDPGTGPHVPRLLADIVTGSDSSSPREFTGSRGATYFVANEVELWKTDGTSSGTVMVRDTGGGPGQAYLNSLHDHNGTLAFVRVDFGSDGSLFATADNHVQLWKSDGTSTGTVLVHDFGVGSFAGLSVGAYFESVDGTLFTVVGTQAEGEELWKTDLTSSGTVLVRDINAGSASSSPANLTSHNGQLLFTATNGQDGVELWRSDGTSSGTVLVKDIETTGSVGSYPGGYGYGFVEKDGSLFFGTRSSGSDGTPFSADDAGQLWKSDGTSSGTVLVKDFGPGSVAGGRLINVGGTLFGTVGTSDLGVELWKSDGTSSGTVLVKDINETIGAYGTSGSHPSELTDVNGTLFFSADDGIHGRELWKSDGTSAGTVLVQDINGSVGAYGSHPYALTNVNGTLYFSADDGIHGSELWRSDGTSAGTVQVKDINQTIGAYGSGGSNIYPMGFVNGSLYFGAHDGEHGSEPWVLHPIVALDYGDAPDSFATLSESDGPSHALGGGLFLGDSVDEDDDGQPSDRADGDDVDQAANDEDGLAVIPRLTRGESVTFDVVVSATGKLDGWIDLNRNGSFENPAEHVNGGVSFDVANGSNSITVQVPATAALGATFARFRISTSGGLTPTGFSSSGEVEDYQVAIRSVTSTSDWQNPVEPLDASGDGEVSPIDALVIINTINAEGARALSTLAGVPASWYDTNGDGSVSAIDVLQVVNRLNGAVAEGETTVVQPLVVAVDTSLVSRRTTSVYDALPPLLTTRKESQVTNLERSGSFFAIEATQATKPIFVSSSTIGETQLLSAGSVESQLERLTQFFLVIGQW